MSPDGSLVAIVAAVNGLPSLFVAKSDGSEVRRIDTGSIVWGATFRPTGSDILFVGPHGADGSYGGLYLIDADGSNLRTLIEPAVDANIEGDPEWSPDGTRIAYARWEPDVVKKDLRVHVISADGTGDVVVGHADDAWLEDGVSAAVAGRSSGGPLWSPDGTRLLIERNSGPQGLIDEGHPLMPVVVTVDGSASDVGIRYAIMLGVRVAWSPDGSVIQATPIDFNGVGLRQELWDPTTGAVKPAPWEATSYPAWQRVAP